MVTWEIIIVLSWTARTSPLVSFEFVGPVIIEPRFSIFVYADHSSSYFNLKSSVKKRFLNEILSTFPENNKNYEENDHFHGGNACAV